MRGTAEALHRSRISNHLHSGPTTLEQQSGTDGMRLQEEGSGRECAHLHHAFLVAGRQPGGVLPDDVRHVLGVPAEELSEHL